MPIEANLARLHEQIAQACRRANRPASEVALMAVSKLHPVEALLEAHAAGHRLFGENRVQEFAEKYPALVAAGAAGPTPTQTDSQYAEGPYPQHHMMGPLRNNNTN